MILESLSMFFYFDTTIFQKLRAVPILNTVVYGISRENLPEKLLN